MQAVVIIILMASGLIFPLSGYGLIYRKGMEWQNMVKKKD